MIGLALALALGTVARAEVTGVQLWDGGAFALPSDCRRACKAGCRERLPDRAGELEALCFGEADGVSDTRCACVVYEPLSGTAPRSPAPGGEVRAAGAAR